MVKGKTRQMLYMALIKQTLRILVMFLFVYRGVLALAWGFMLTGILGGLLYIYIGMKYLGYTLGEFLCDNGKIVLLSFGVSLLLYIILINIELGGLYIIMGGIFVFCGYLPRFCPFTTHHFFAGTDKRAELHSRALQRKLHHGATCRPLLREPIENFPLVSRRIENHTRFL